MIVTLAMLMRRSSSSGDSTCCGVVSGVKDLSIMGSVFMAFEITSTGPSRVRRRNENDRRMY
jgi:hypothetical protein